MVARREWQLDHELLESIYYTTLSDARVPSALDSLYLVVCPYRHLPCFHPPPAVVQTALRYAGRRKAEGLGRRSDGMVPDEDCPNWEVPYSLVEAAGASSHAPIDAAVAVCEECVRAEH